MLLKETSCKLLLVPAAALLRAALCSAGGTPRYAERNGKEKKGREEKEKQTLNRTERKQPRTARCLRL